MNRPAVERRTAWRCYWLLSLAMLAAGLASWWRLGEHALKALQHEKPGKRPTDTYLPGELPEVKPDPSYDTTVADRATLGGAGGGGRSRTESARKGGR